MKIEITIFLKIDDAETIEGYADVSDELIAADYLENHMSWEKYITNVKVQRSKK